MNLNLKVFGTVKAGRDTPEQFLLLSSRLAWNCFKRQSIALIDQFGHPLPKRSIHPSDFEEREVSTHGIENEQ
jgi:hypothetical protein